MNGRLADGTAWQEHGPADAPAVVLIHGLGLHRDIWAAHLPALAARWRVLSYDLYGHGETGPAPEPPDLALYARQILGLMDARGIGRAVLAGFSLGGMINRRFAIDHPGRTAGLAILNSPHERDAAAQRAVEERAAASTAGPGATLDAAIARWFTPGFRAAHPDAIARVRRWVLANEPAAYAACRLVLARGVTELIRPDPPLAVPALVMTCAHDSGSTPAMARAIAAEIAGAECIVVPGLQHMGLYERPELFAAPLGAFLDRVWGTTGEIRP